MVERTSQRPPGKPGTTGSTTPRAPRPRGSVAAAEDLDANCVPEVTRFTPFGIVWDYLYGMGSASVGLACGSAAQPGEIG